MTTAERVRELIEPLLAAEGVEVDDVVLAGGTLRVVVDRPSGGIDLDAVTAATETVSRALDTADPLPGRYLLEVSSPGVERTLRTPEHFRRALGSTIAVKTHDGPDSERRVEGELESADDRGIVVAGRPLTYDEIERARTVFHWGPAPKPGKKKKAAVS